MQETESYVRNFPEYGIQIQNENYLLLDYLFQKHDYMAGIHWFYFLA